MGTWEKNSTTVDIWSIMINSGCSPITWPIDLQIDNNNVMYVLGDYRVVRLFPNLTSEEIIQLNNTSDYYYTYTGEFNILCIRFCTDVSIFSCSEYFKS